MQRTALSLSLSSGQESDFKEKGPLLSQLSALLSVGDRLSSLQ